MSDTIFKGPYETQLIVHVTDGETVGALTMTLTMGNIPTQEDIDEAIQKAKEATEGQGFRLMNKMEFFNQMMKERLGATEQFACPGGNEWDS